MVHPRYLLDDVSDTRRITLRFRVSYHTVWGQRLVVVGDGAMLGNWNNSRGVRMACHHDKDDLVWEASVRVPYQDGYQYRYVVLEAAGPQERVVTQSIHTRQVLLHDSLEDGAAIELVDTWVARSHPSNVFSTSAFTKVIRPHHQAVHGGTVAALRCREGEVVVRFQVADWLLNPGEALAVMGGVPQLGSWQPDQMMRLTETDTPWWEGEIRVPESTLPFTFKYAIVWQDGHLLEAGEARLLSTTVEQGEVSPSVVVRHDGFFRRDRLWRGSGLAVPVFSLRSRQGLGVGEFLDVTLLVDVAACSAFRVVQLLPVNDTSVHGTWWDSYPYSTLSVFALHPQYLRVQELMEGGLPRHLQHEVSEWRRKLEGDQVNYEKVMRAKRELVEKVFDEGGREDLESREFKAWAEQNKDWLLPYAAFCILKDLFGTSEHWKWGVMAKPNPQMIARLVAPTSNHYRAVQVVYYTQWHLHKQLMQVSNYAQKRRVVLKGDLPIGVDKWSVDTWLEPHIFNMDKSTGSPPDVFDSNGQNWGFPTYNWDAMALDDYNWWRRRLRHMSQYFHCYRVDHILGFFRIWEIPGDCVTGLLGRFRPSHPITRAELVHAGIKDVDRLVKPYVTQHILDQEFGEQASAVGARYFVEAPEGVFTLRTEFSSEKAISDIPIRKDSPKWLVDEMTAVKKGLMKVRQNVLMLPDDHDPDSFYPRFDLMSSSSYQEVPEAWKGPLRTLHDHYFYQRQDALWRQHALKTLSVLMTSTDMLLCGEDLGFVPACVPPMMNELGIIGLRIQRMSSTPGVEFNDPSTYPYLVVASPSCHDVSTLRAWYEEDPDRRDRFYFNALDGPGRPPLRCTPAVVRAVLQQHLDSPAILAIFPIQDVLALKAKYAERPPPEEIINDPTVAKHYWRYRMHVPLEDLLADEELLALLQELNVGADRATLADLEEAIGLGGS